jgi:hypothetical protein
MSGNPLKFSFGAQNVLFASVATIIQFTAGGQLNAQSEIPLGSLLFWDVTQRRFVCIDVSGQPIGSTLKGQAVQETSVTALPPTLRIIQELQSSNSQRCGSLKSRISFGVHHRPGRSACRYIERAERSVFLSTMRELNSQNIILLGKLY